MPIAFPANSRHSRFVKPGRAAEGIRQRLAGSRLIQSSRMSAHADVGDPDCCGCIGTVIRVDVADITCNECGAVVKLILSEF